jgi:membrane associated rhomboid family serine protease/Tfp pilus assembly protein PilF
LCPACGLELLNPGAPAVVPPPPPPPVRRRRPPLKFWLKSPTVQIIAVNTVIFLAVCISGRSLTPRTTTLLHWGANFGGLTLSGQWWRLLSCAFLHAGVFHLALNMWALLNLGILAELLFGRVVYVALYFFCALGGSLASLWWHADVVGVGASGAIFGVAGALLTALAFQHNRQMRAAMRGHLTSIALFVFYNIAFGAAAAQVDNAAHLGGLVTGLVLGALLPSGARTALPEEAPQAVSPGSQRQAPAWRLAGFRHAGALRSWLTFGLIAVLLLASAGYARRKHRDALAMSSALRALRNGDHALAFQQLQGVLQRHPNSAEAHFLLANVYLQGDDLDNGVRELKHTIELNPKFTEAQSQLCSVYARQESLREALPYCQAAVALDPANPTRLYNLGLVQMALKDYAAAIKSLQAAVQAQPNSVDENYELGVALFLNGETEKAAAQMEKVLRLAPNNNRARQLLNTIKTQKKQ